MLLFETEEAQQALASGVDPGDPAEFLEAMIHLKDHPRYAELSAFLADRGLTIGQTLDMVTEAIDAEATASLSQDPKKDGIVQRPAVSSARCRAAIVQLHARGFEPVVITRLLILEPGQVERFLSSRGTSLDEVTVMTRHRAGATPLEISRQLGCPRASVDAFLRRLGITPNVRKARVTDDLKTRIITMYNAGRDYPTIEEIVGVTGSQLRSVLRTAAKKGMLPGYGSGARRGAA